MRISTGGEEGFGVGRHSVWCWCCFVVVVTRSKGKEGGSKEGKLGEEGRQSRLEAMEMAAGREQDQQ